MLRWHHRDRLGGDVDPQTDQFLVYVGEMPLHEIGGHMADIQMHVIEAEFLDLGINRAGDDIARGQFQPLVIERHEAFAGARVDQAPAFAAHRLGDQEVFDL